MKSSPEICEAALSVVFDSDAGDNLTIRQYFRELLLTLWKEGEDFSGKRPFGNSGWETQPMLALAKEGFVDLGEWDEECEDYSYATSTQWKEAEKFVAELIRHALTSAP